MTARKATGRALGYLTRPDGSRLGIYDATLAQYLETAEAQQERLQALERSWWVKLGRALRLVARRRKAPVAERNGRPG